jgi:predicted RNase H-like HicB family nuclease
VNSRYEIIIYWSDEDDCFVAEVPELPGCLADGDTYQEAVTNAESAIHDWLDTAVRLGRAIPKPKGRLQFA